MVDMIAFYIQQLMYAMLLVLKVSACLFDLPYLLEKDPQRLLSSRASNEVLIQSKYGIQMKSAVVEFKLLSSVTKL